MHNHCTAWSDASRSVNAARTQNRICVSRKQSSPSKPGEKREHHFANPSNLPSPFDLYESGYVLEMNASRWIFRSDAPLSLEPCRRLALRSLIGRLQRHYIGWLPPAIALANRSPNNGPSPLHAAAGG
jgi:hypothetical protein